MWARRRGPTPLGGAWGILGHARHRQRSSRSTSSGISKLCGFCDSEDSADCGTFPESALVMRRSSVRVRSPAPVPSCVSAMPPLFRFGCTLVASREESSSFLSVASRSSRCPLLQDMAIGVQRDLHACCLRRTSNLISWLDPDVCANTKAVSLLIGVVCGHGILYTQPG